MWPTHYLPRQNRPGIPPVQFYLTTPPYPLEMTESLLSSGEGQNAVFGIGADEDFTSSGEPVSGLLRDILVRYDHEPPEELISSSEAVSGLLRDILIRMEGPLDEIVASSEPVGGELILTEFILYDNWPLAAELENVLSSGAPVSGVLT